MKTIDIKSFVKVLCCFVFLAVFLLETRAETGWPQVAVSQDGTPVSYEVCGAGEPTLVFVHGWSCDARYWREQIPRFSKNHRVVTLDLAGHGHSGTDRTEYTMKAFGEDVRAATEAVGSTNIILIGHSMGGVVIAEAARLLPGRIIGLIGIDTLENVEYPMTPEELQKMIAPLKEHFKEGARQFAGDMIAPKTDPLLREWILSDMSAAPPRVGVSAMKEMMTLYITGEMATIFEEIHLPVITINADMWPVNYEANRRHMASFDAIILKDADHFLMMNRPDEFNAALEKAIRRITEHEPL